MSMSHRNASTAQRRKWAAQGIALPDGSFPIPTRAALKDAKRAVGRASNPERAKAHIRKRAKALGCSVDMAQDVLDVWTVLDLVSGDTSPFSSSTTSNWVARRGGLPGRVRAIARAIKRKNPSWSLSRCIATAINAVKYSAATGDAKGLPGRQNEKPDTVAAHGAAAARWEAMKASAGGGKRKRAA